MPITDEEVAAIQECFVEALNDYQPDLGPTEQLGFRRVGDCWVAAAQPTAYAGTLVGLLPEKLRSLMELKGHDNWTGYTTQKEFEIPREKSPPLALTLAFAILHRKDQDVDADEVMDTYVAGAPTWFGSQA